MGGAVPAATRFVTWHRSPLRTASPTLSPAGATDIQTSVLYACVPVKLNAGIRTISRGLVCNSGFVKIRAIRGQFRSGVLRMAHESHESARIRERGCLTAACKEPARTGVLVYGFTELWTFSEPSHRFSLSEVQGSRFLNFGIRAR